MTRRAAAVATVTAFLGLLPQSALAARAIVGGPVPSPEAIVYVVGTGFAPESKLCDRVAIAVAGRSVLFRDRFSDEVGTWVIAIRAPNAPGRYRVRLTQLCRNADTGKRRLTRASTVLTVLAVR